MNSIASVVYLVGNTEYLYAVRTVQKHIPRVYHHTVTFRGRFGVGCDSGRPEVTGVTPDVLPNINGVGRRGERDLFVCIWPWRFFDDG